MDLMPGKESSAQAADTGNESASSLVSRISGDLTNLVRMMDKTKGFSPEDNAPAQQLLQQFQSYANEVLLASPNAKPAPKEPPMNPGAAPMEAMGNPNARPM